jgi:hypothetical protein
VSGRVGAGVASNHHHLAGSNVEQFPRIGGQHVAAIVEELNERHRGRGILFRFAESASVRTFMLVGFEINGGVRNDKRRAAGCPWIGDSADAAEYDNFLPIGDALPNIRNAAGVCRLFVEQKLRCLSYQLCIRCRLLAAAGEKTSGCQKRHQVPFVSHGFLSRGEKDWSAQGDVGGNDYFGAAVRIS